MKRSNLLNLFVVLLVCGLSQGCNKKPVGLTPVPGESTTPRGAGPGPLIDRGPRVDDTKVGATDVIPLGGAPINLDDYTQDHDTFQSSTAYFDFDSAAVKGSEKTKVETVANYFKRNNTDKLMIEGHCDERGTEGYNLSLGERRALALREYLANLGVSADRIYTKSYGEAKPAVQGHTEAAWSKNRRGEFVLLKPK